MLEKEYLTEELFDHELEEISRLVKEGYTSGQLDAGEGNKVSWSITINVLSRTKKQLLCPVCGSPIRVKRVDDGESVIEINEEGLWTEIGADSNGYTSVYCSKDEEHDLPEDLKEAALEIWERYELGEV